VWNTTTKAMSNQGKLRNNITLAKLLSLLPQKQHYEQLPPNQTFTLDYSLGTCHTLALTEKLHIG